MIPSLSVMEQNLRPIIISSPGRPSDETHRKTWADSSQMPPLSTGLCEPVILGRCRRQGPILPRINGKISSCSWIHCGLLQLSGLHGNGYLSQLNCYVGSSSFCAGRHFPPLPPGQILVSLQNEACLPDSILGQVYSGTTYMDSFLVIFSAWWQQYWLSRGICLPAMLSIQAVCREAWGVDSSLWQQRDWNWKGKSVILWEWDSPENLGKREPQVHLRLDFLFYGKISEYSF